MGAKEAAQQVLKVPLGQDPRPDPYLELLRLGAASEHIEAEAVVTLMTVVAEPSRDRPKPSPPTPPPAGRRRGCATALVPEIRPPG
ncbi:hypothetical protein ACIRD3_03930 [Kitasatospora sp. NPDC093550]|uniref:hypothetical protein n=1 Tax=Kitasatospora sp. NPDC093550 TaxID=3364089 RepID=UPI00380DF338